MEFKVPTGWLTKFKDRHGLKLRRIYGSSFTAQQVNYSDFITTLKQKIQEYGIENVFNTDKSGVFYKLIPSKSICKNVRKGHKLLKDRISILFCTNITGNFKIKPLVCPKNLDV